MKFSVITNCSSKKRAFGSTTTSCQTTKFNSLTGFAREWVVQLGESERRVNLVDLYQGRAFAESRRAARLSNADLYVISAGLGLVHESEQVPNYSLTISDGPGSIRRWLEAREASPSDWWIALTEELGSPNPLSTLVNRTAIDTLVLLALPASYLGMVSQDLGQVSPTRIGQLRLFTSEAGFRLLPKHLKESAMPYDDRLEGLATHAGTRTEFPHRALRHFVEKLQGHLLPPHQAKAAVTSALRGVQSRFIPKRVKATDAQIGLLVRANWVAHGGSSTRLLRFLRDEAMVACEQSRFRSLWQLIRAEIPHDGVN